ncbi:YbaB/EbfC family nucleoid-associated protein [Krasilnikovia sp. M28-CT-15]|uniref:YbaB/EbfC family nucleoid-associated protein n=1 Tax=Krasilnikovia sp. M28-CT-15 TaxID=3373540 RepID=UPI00399C7F57
MRLNAAEELRRLQQTAASLIRQPPPAAGSDESGTVEVYLNAEGHIDRIEIRPDWSRQVDAESIGHAVLAAANDAVNRRASAWADLMSRTPEETVAALEVRDVRAAAPRIDAESRSAGLHELMKMITGALAEADELTDRLEELAQRPIIGRSNNASHSARRPDNDDRLVTGWGSAAWWAPGGY